MITKARTIIIIDHSLMFAVALPLNHKFTSVSPHTSAMYQLSQHLELYLTMNGISYTAFTLITPPPFSPFSSTPLFTPLFTLLSRMLNGAHCTVLL